MPHFSHDMLYAAIFTVANVLAIGGAGWLLMFPFPPVSNEPVAAVRTRIDWARRS